MLNKITAVTVLSCVVSALAFVKPVSAKITVELEEPDWQFVMRQHHRDDHGISKLWPLRTDSLWEIADI